MRPDSRVRSQIDEGGVATFTVTATPAPGKPLRVTLYIGQEGRFAQPGATGQKRVTGPTSGTLPTPSRR